MRLKKFFLSVFTLTVMSLIYTQMQFNIYALAYNGKEKEKEVFKLVDENNYVSYNIAKLKSANRLGLELLTDKTDVDFLDYDNIVQLKSPAPQKTDVISKATLKPRFRLLAGLFSLQAEAEARPIR